MRKIKVAPEAASKEAIAELMEFANEYSDIKMRTQYYPLRRPSFMKRLHVSLSGWERSGVVKYDREHAGKLHEQDLQFIRQYERDMRILFFLEHGFASIKDDRIREIGFKTLIGHERCKDVSEEYKLCISSVYIARNRAKDYVAKFIEENRKKYGKEVTV